jgi:hypothetical protein
MTRLTTFLDSPGLSKGFWEGNAFDINSADHLWLHLKNGRRPKPGCCNPEDLQWAMKKILNPPEIS